MILREKMLGGLFGEASNHMLYKKNYQFSNKLSIKRNPVISKLSGTDLFLSESAEEKSTFKGEQKPHYTSVKNFIFKINWVTCKNVAMLIIPISNINR